MNLHSLLIHDMSETEMQVLHYFHYQNFVQNYFDI